MILWLRLWMIWIEAHKQRDGLEKLVFMQNITF